jgi:hypothetical protein
LLASISRNPFLTIRTGGDPTPVLGALREAVHEMDKSVAIYQVSTLENNVSKSDALPRFQTMLPTCFAGIALFDIRHSPD